MSHRWHYESDGDRGARTHYAVRFTDQNCETCGRFHGFERRDFPSAAAALKFIVHENKRSTQINHGRSHDHTHQT